MATKDAFASAAIGLVALRSGASTSLTMRYVLSADEHYVPTLLAYLGKEQETDCWGFMVNVDWSRGGAPPPDIRGRGH